MRCWLWQNIPISYSVKIVFVALKCSNIQLRLILLVLYMKMQFDLEKKVLHVGADVSVPDARKSQKQYKALREKTPAALEDIIRGE